MPESSGRWNRLNRPARWSAALGVSVVWLLVVALSVARLRSPDGLFVALAGLAAVAATFGLMSWSDRARWQLPINEMTKTLHDLRQDPRMRPPQDSESEPQLAELKLAIAGIAKVLRSRAFTRRITAPAVSEAPPKPQPMQSQASFTRSGLFDAPPTLEAQAEPENDPATSGDYSTADMVNRLDPLRFRWIESSTAEQIFLGWELADLRQRSFLDILHPDDRGRTQETFARALSRGEALGLIVRIKPAHGTTRAVEVNVGARYGTNQKVTHLRCHLTDVTDKVRADRALKLRTVELTQVNEQLRRINRELEEVKDTLSHRNRELDEFVHVVSHDLQEPLRTLIAFSDFLLKDYGDKLESEGQEFVRYLVDASRRMRSMILGMLNLARVGKVIGEHKWVDLDDLLSVIRTDLGELLRSKNAEIRIAGPLPQIWGDRDRIGQLLANLINNGVKYNKSLHPWVEVSATLNAGTGPPRVEGDLSPNAEVILSVKDNGIGIEPQFYSTIFQLFRRLHPREEFDGTGAGLAICSKIVQAHGGRIWVESTVGEGSTFFVRLRGGWSAASAAQLTSPTLHENEMPQVPVDEHNAR
jgi:PAS domain S-box-containing protein